MYIAFWIKEPYDGYVWDDSRAKVTAVDFLGKRSLEVTKGTNGSPSYLFREFREVPVDEVESLLGGNPVLFVDEIYDQTATNLLARPKQEVTAEAIQRIIAAGSVATLRIIDTTNQTKMPTGVWNDREARYRVFGKDRESRKGYFLTPDESPALTERLEAVVNKVETALPGILSLTNQLQRVLDNTANTAAHADQLLSSAEPALTNITLLTENFATISKHLTNPRGSLGDWLIPTNLGPQLTQTLVSANALLTNSDARLAELASGLDRAIDHLAGLTGELHTQVRGNTNLVTSLSRLIIDADDLVQGLKRHWLLRSAFRGSSSPSPPSKSRRATSPKDERPSGK
jgi:ABC-type transporter Mla subunit MlaD